VLKRRKVREQRYKVEGGKIVTSRELLERVWKARYLDLAGKKVVGKEIEGNSS